MYKAPSKATPAGLMALGDGCRDVGGWMIGKVLTLKGKGKNERGVNWACGFGRIFSCLLFFKFSLGRWYPF